MTVPIGCRAEVWCRATLAPRAAGRIAAEPLDAAEHGGMVAARRRPIMVPDGLFKRLSIANTRRVWRDLLDRAEKET
jgi:hypothetical protein